MSTLYTGLALDEMRDLLSKKTWKITDNSMAINLIQNYLNRGNYHAAHETIELLRMKREKELKQNEPILTD